MAVGATFCEPHKGKTNPSTYAKAKTPPDPPRERAAEPVPIEWPRLENPVQFMEDENEPYLEDEEPE